MGSSQRLIAAACVALSLVSASPAVATSTSSTAAAKYKAAAELFRGALDLRELEIRGLQARLVDKDETIAAWKATATAHPVIAEGAESWIWPALAGVAIAAFAGGFALAWAR